MTKGSMPVSSNLACFLFIFRGIHRFCNSGEPYFLGVHIQMQYRVGRLILFQLFKFLFALK